MNRNSYTESTLETLTEGICLLRRSFSSRKKKRKPLSAIDTSGTGSGPCSPTQSVHQPLRAARSNPQSCGTFDL
ncbi:hypothetical protein DPMN_191910 [Dreissena polymorpha]|uniref:Uncharacterized protein n=1 Tax=Dreissena polymorpha TaxID=45954 RepID=A0A9D4B4X8_DREPO|nr:hypothetical protein DPMN_191910 [Dreissena polymorpha]